MRFYFEHGPFSVLAQLPSSRLFFPKWHNSVQITTLQIIRHVLLSTNFDTLQLHLWSMYNGIITQKLGGSNPSRGGEVFNF